MTGDDFVKGWPTSTQISEDARRYLKIPADTGRCLWISGDAYRYRMPADTGTYQKIS